MQFAGRLWSHEDVLKIYLFMFVPLKRKLATLLKENNWKYTTVIQEFKLCELIQLVNTLVHHRYELSTQLRLDAMA